MGSFLWTTQISWEKKYSVDLSLIRKLQQNLLMVRNWDSVLRKAPWAFGPTYSGQYEAKLRKSQVYGSDVNLTKSLLSVFAIRMLYELSCRRRLQCGRFDVVAVRRFQAGGGHQRLRRSALFRRDSGAATRRRGQWVILSICLVRETYSSSSDYIKN